MDGDVDPLDGLDEGDIVILPWIQEQVKSTSNYGNEWITGF